MESEEGAKKIQDDMLTLDDENKSETINLKSSDEQKAPPENASDSKTRNKEKSETDKHGETPEHERPLLNETKIEKHGCCEDITSLEKPLKKKIICIVLFCIVFVILYTLILTLGLIFGLPRQRIDIVEGAVVSDHETCSTIGRDALAKGGSAVDASIATLLCLGLMSPHSMGIGGGNFMIVYSEKNKRLTTFDARESAPALVAPAMFKTISSPQSPLFIGVPGEIRGYWEAHIRFGRLPWKDLFQPTIDLAENGYHLSSPTADAIQVLQNKLKKNISSFPGFCDIYCDKHGIPLVDGSLMKTPKLAKTLRGIAEKGVDYLYKGEVAERLAHEIQSAGGILNKKDFVNYKVRVESGIRVDLGKLDLLTLGAPSGGPVLSLILNIINGLRLTPESMATPENQVHTYHAIIEAIKLSYADRARLADPAYVETVDAIVQKMLSKQFADTLRARLDRKQTHNASYYTDIVAEDEEFGTSHVSVLAPDGDAVSVTSTINTYFGSFVFSESTGINWNNELLDFANPNTKQHEPQSPNSIEAGKRPLSAMVPAIFVDKDGKVQIVVGAAGGSAITTTVAQISAGLLWFGDDVFQAIRRRRIHNQLSPNTLKYEHGFPEDIIDGLKKKGHKVQRRDRFISVAQVIARNPQTGEITAHSDERKVSGQAKYIRRQYDMQKF